MAAEEAVSEGAVASPNSAVQKTQEMKIGTDNYDKVASNQAEMFGSKVKFEIKVATQKDVRNFEVVEAFEENYGGGLSNRNVSIGSPCRAMYVHQIENETCEIGIDNAMEMVSSKFRIFVDDDPNAISVIQNWEKPGEFDDLAFQNAVMDKRQVRIIKIKRIH